MNLRYIKEENSINIPEDFEQTFFKDPFVTTDLTATVMLKSKGIIEEIFKDEVLPFWETEVVKNVKGGKPREFYIITS